MERLRLIARELMRFLGINESGAKNSTTDRFTRKRWADLFFALTLGPLHTSILVLALEKALKREGTMEHLKIDQPPLEAPLEHIQIVRRQNLNGKEIS